MKYYLIIGSIIIVLMVGSLFLFTGKPVEVETLHFTIGEKENAIEELQFTIKFPTYIPENLKMKDASINVLDGKHEMIAFSYMNAVNSYGFEFYASTSKDPLDSIARNNDYWDWNEVEVNGLEALIGVNGSKKEKSLVFRDENILYRFYAENMETEELLKIANSMK